MLQSQRCQNKGVLWEGIPRDQEEQGGKREVFQVNHINKASTCIL